MLNWLRSSFTSPFTSTHSYKKLLPNQFKWQKIRNVSWVDSPVTRTGPSSEPDLQNFRIWLLTDQCPHTYSERMEHWLNSLSRWVSQHFEDQIQFFPCHWVSATFSVEPPVDDLPTLIDVYASPSRLPGKAQDSLSGGAGCTFRSRTFTCKISAAFHNAQLSGTKMRRIRRKHRFSTTLHFGVMLRLMSRVYCTAFDTRYLWQQYNEQRKALLWP